VRAMLKGIDELLRRQVAFDYAIGPDLSVLLSDFHVFAAGPDFMVFDLSRKATQSAMIATNLTSPTESF
jgi:hypothetical protein